MTFSYGVGVGVGLSGCQQNEEKEKEKNCYLKTLCDGVRSSGRGKVHASDADGKSVVL